MCFSHYRGNSLLLGFPDYMKVTDLKRAMIQEPSSHDPIRCAVDMYQSSADPEIGNGHISPSEKLVRNLGSIYTPPDFAQFLTSWAIQSSRDKILDVGIGEGAFTFAAYYRLLELGARAEDAQQQLYGAEVDASTYARFSQRARNLGANFPNLHHTNFFDIDFPPVDVVVGNPPYVRRTYMEDIDHIRRSVLQKNGDVDESYMPRLTDLYVYFLLRALPALRRGGRLAVITSDPWLNTVYGSGFKKYLQRHFAIESLISLDRRVFNDAQVKPVLMLATKKESVLEEQDVHFIRVKNGLPIRQLQLSLGNLRLDDTNVACVTIKGSELKASHPWGIHFKAPAIHEEFASHALMAPLMDVAATRIGIQTLAKDFFTLTPEQAEAAYIETEFLAPLAQSSRYVKEPIIAPGAKPAFYLFSCAKSKEELEGTHALEYILAGEAAEVQVRGKDTSLVGYHSKDRIRRASRRFWYDLRTMVERRGCAPIFVPRLVYRTFTVVWNQAGFVPGELFIEVLPPPGLDTEVYLAILTSSISEIMLRASAQVYGGGTYNVNPGQIKRVPVLNARLLTKQQQAALKRSYGYYVSDGNHDRSAIDAVVFDILGFSGRKRQKLQDVLEDLVLIATSSKRSSLGS